jgi:hypothetical protein
MSLATAQKRLDEMLADLDRSIAVLRGEQPEAEHHTADAGASLSDTERADAALDAMTRQRAEVLGHLRQVCRLRPADDGGAAGGTSRGVALHRLPGEARPLPSLRPLALTSS